MLEGDDSHGNRLKMAEAHLQMSAIMLDFEEREGVTTLIGDLDFAEQCAESAFNLMRDGDGDLILSYVRERAEKQFARIQATRAALEREPERFALRPKYGPFPVRRMS